MEWYLVLLTIFFVVLCLAIILIVLIQPGQSEGLAGSFGSGGMIGSAFGVHAKNRLIKITTTMVILFFLIIFTYNVVNAPDDGDKAPSIMGEEEEQAEPGSLEAPAEEATEPPAEDAEETAAPEAAPAEEPAAVPEETPAPAPVE